jgi:hypothetical protein
MFRRKKDRGASRQKSDAATYTDALTDRIRGLSANGGYDASEEEAAEVEARLRRMFYGAKKEDDFTA